jgi:hypothetical protein
VTIIERAAALLDRRSAICDAHMVFPLMAMGAFHSL